MPRVIKATLLLFTAFVINYVAHLFIDVCEPFVSEPTCMSGWPLAIIKVSGFGRRQEWIWQNVVMNTIIWFFILFLGYRAVRLLRRSKS